MTRNLCRNWLRRQLSHQYVYHHRYSEATEFFASEDRNLKQDSLTFDFGGERGIVKFTEIRTCSNFFQGKKSMPPWFSTHQCHLKHLDCLRCFDYMEGAVHSVTSVNKSPGEVLRNC